MSTKEEVLAEVCLLINTMAREYFKQSDTNGDGVISFEEYSKFESVMQKAEQGGNCVVDHTKIQEDFKNLDTNGDGVLQLEELLAQTDPMVEGLKADLQNSTVEELSQFKTIFVDEMNKAIDQIKNVEK